MHVLTACVNIGVACLMLHVNPICMNTYRHGDNDIYADRLNSQLPACSNQCTASRVIMHVMFALPNNENQSLCALDVVRELIISDAIASGCTSCYAGVTS